jgi:hypothetical protein
MSGFVRFYKPLSHSLKRRARIRFYEKPMNKCSRRGKSSPFFMDSRNSISAQTEDNG